jgi:hypothetical protein
VPGNVIKLARTTNAAGGRGGGSGLLVNNIISQHNKLKTPEKCTLKVYKRGVALSGLKGRGGCPGKRGIITDFSAAVRRRLSKVFIQGPWRSMVTLTYHHWDNNNMPYRMCKKQSNSWKQELRRRGILYMWVVEFQRRGAPHYHVWLDRELSETERIEIMECWLRVSGQENDNQARDFALHSASYTPWTITEKSNYAAKYGDKNKTKVLPAGVKSFGKWWGCSYNLKLEQEEIEIPEVSKQVIRRQVKRYIEKVKSERVFQKVEPTSYVTKSGAIGNSYGRCELVKKPSHNVKLPQLMIHSDFERRETTVLGCLKSVRRFPKDKIGSRLSFYTVLSPDQVKDVLRLVNYYSPPKVIDNFFHEQLKKESMMIDHARLVSNAR